mgnify:CR=1 FL=1
MATLLLICSAAVSYNGTSIALLRPEPNLNTREHVTLEFLKERIEFEVGVIYEMTIRKVE